MASTPKGARVVGAVAVRAVPDTSKFIADLKRELREMVTQEVKVDAKIDPVLNKSEFERIKQQLRGLKGLVDIKFDLKMADLRKEIREAIRDATRQLGSQMELEFDNLKVDVEASRESIEKTRHDVESLINDLDNSEIMLDANANTLVASQQIRYTARPRFVDLTLRVTKSSMASVATAIAALSGARLVGNQFDNLWDFFKELDKNLPRVGAINTAIYGLTGALFGATSGLVSFGAGLTQISALLLPIPGMLAGLVAIVVSLGVAWADVGDVLGDLEEPFKNLQDIMSAAYWSEAEEPIRTFINELMPQMEEALAGSSRAIGGFTGALAEAFGEEFANGRFTEIFSSLEEGFRIMEGGADGFAGAMTNLMLIAARYFPDFADWLTRNANTFDQWLTDISTDGRLDTWIQQGKDALYDLWFGFMALGQVFGGLWTAAENAGATALQGFREEMEEWAEIVNSPESQAALEDFFRGGREVIDAVGDAISSVFGALSDESGLVRDIFFEVADTIRLIGDLLGSVLGDSNFLMGVEEMFAGFNGALEEMEPAMEPLALLLGSIAAFIGTVSESLAGPLSQAIQTFAPIISQLLMDMEGPIEEMSTFFEEILADPTFQAAAQEVGEALGVIAVELGKIVTNENVKDIIMTLVTNLGILAAEAPILIEGLSGIVQFLLGPFKEGMMIGSNTFSFLAWALTALSGVVVQVVAWIVNGMAMIFWETERYLRLAGTAIEMFLSGDLAGIPAAMDGINADIDAELANVFDFTSQWTEDANASTDAYWNTFMNKWNGTDFEPVKGIGERYTDAISEGMGRGDVGGAVAGMQDKVRLQLEAGKSVGSEGGVKIAQSYADGIKSAQVHANRAAIDTINTVKTAFAKGSGTLLTKDGLAAATSYTQGIRLGTGSVLLAAMGLRMTAQAGVQGMYSSGYAAGSDLGRGIRDGINAQVQGIAKAAAAAVTSATSAARKAGEMRSPSRLWRREIGEMLGKGGALGIRDSASLMATAAREVIPSPLGVADAIATSTSTENITTNGPTFNNYFPASETPRKDAQEVLWEFNRFRMSSKGTVADDA